MMAMGTLGKAMKATRTHMIESETDRVSEDFATRFGMRDGDYIRVKKSNRQPTTARIVSVEECYWNNAGGYTASITIAPLLVGGRLGKTRSCLLSVHANGGGLKAFHFYEGIERLPQRRSEE